jgi:hypothetical protein
MKLYELGIPFTKVSTDILLLSSRTAILEALRLYGGKYALGTLKTGTPYSRRKQREDLKELAHHDLVTLDANGIPSLNEIPGDKAAEVPTLAPWDDLSFAESKTCIALYAVARNQRSPYFTYQGTREELAAIARLNRKATGAALFSLSEKGICNVRAIRDKGSRWTRGASVQLLDSESGASLNDRGWFFRNRLNELDVLTRYRLALNPQFDFIHGFTADSGMMLACPLCLNPKRTLRVTATETADAWKCFACGKSGDSASLCALRSFRLWKAPEFNLTQIAAYLGASGQQSLEGISNACIG